MKTGLDWYKREPVAFLGGMQGMTARQIAVYNVVIDLMYQHGGAVNNDPSWFAGWIKDVGPSAARNTIGELVEMGRLEVDPSGMLTNKIVKNSAKTKQKLSETRAKTGRKGGINSGFSRAADKENNALDEAKASSKNEAEKIREDKKVKEDTNVSSKNPMIDVVRQLVEEAPPPKPPKPKAKKQQRAMPALWIAEPNTILHPNNIASATKAGMTSETMRHEITGFIDHHLSKDTRSADWDASWRQWCKGWIKYGSKQFGRTGGGGMANGSSSGRSGQGDGGLAGAFMRRHAGNAVQPERPASVDISGRGNDPELCGGGGKNSTVVDASAAFENRGMAGAVGWYR